MSIGRYETALVTGASSGIGEAVVGLLTGEGMVVHAVARRHRRLIELADRTGCEIHVLDVRDSDRLIDLGRSLSVDVLVNNAGVGRGFGSIVDAGRAEAAETIDTNVRAVVHVIQAVLPGMIQRKRGHVVNIGSMAGLYPLSSAIYGASKGAIHLLSLNLRLELQGTGVRVTEIAPGRVDTEFYASAVEDDQRRAEILDTGTTNLQPEDVAQAVGYSLSAPAHVNVNRVEIQATEQTYGGSQFVPGPS